LNSILIIGSGQIGSRHLQGVLRSKLKLVVYVFDPSIESINLSKARASEIEHEHLINYITDVIELPNKINTAIIATDASIRYKVTVELLNKIQIQFLILEKVLFQEVDEYFKFNEIIKERKLNVWVNLPRRMYPYYSDLKETIKQNRLKKFDVIYVGNNWGIGCNAIHLIDLIAFLTNSKTIEWINCEFLDYQVSTTKRDKFMEFTGKLVVRFEDTTLTLVSHKKPDTGNPLLVINSENDKWIIQEGKSISHISNNEQLIKTNFNFKDYFQSSLTTVFIEQLLNKGTCELPRYEDSEKLHIPFIKELLGFQNKLLNENSSKLRVT
jgi:predicted dehydrogenase